MPKDKKVKEVEDEPDLEEVVEESDSKEFEIDENKFTEFIETSNQRAPILDKVQNFQSSKVTNLESSAFEEGSIDEREENSKDLNYEISKDKKDDVKYSSDNRNKFYEIQQPGLHQESKNEDLFEKREVGLIESDKRGFQSSTIEKYTLPKKLNSFDSKKKDLFEKPEVKYKSPV